MLGVGQAGVTLNDRGRGRGWKFCEKRDVIVEWPFGITVRVVVDAEY